MIEALLKIKFPIYWGSWPIEEEFSRFLIYSIITQRPRVIVELGSGLSTLLIIKTLESLGYSYKIYSIDSDMDFLEKTKNLLISEGVYNKRKIKLIHAPLENIKIENKNYTWYSRDSFEKKVKDIDFLFIDGPVGGLCKNARYPALKFFSNFFNKKKMFCFNARLRKA